MFDPKNPEAYFKIFHALQDTAFELQQDMLGEEEDEEADNHQFFDDVREKHKVLIDLQKDLHEDVVDVENKWANVRTLSAIHKQYHSAVSFFQEKEIKLQAMAEKMQNLTDTIAMLPEKT